MAAAPITVFVTITIRAGLALACVYAAERADLVCFAGASFFKFGAGDGPVVEGVSVSDCTKVECGHVPIGIAKISIVFAEPGPPPIGKL